MSNQTSLYFQLQQLLKNGRFPKDVYHTCYGLEFYVGPRHKRERFQRFDYYDYFTAYVKQKVWSDDTNNDDAVANTLEFEVIIDKHCTCAIPVNDFKKSDIMELVKETRNNFNIKSNDFRFDYQGVERIYDYQFNRGKIYRVSRYNNGFLKINVKGMTFEQIMRFNGVDYAKCVEDYRQMLADSERDGIKWETLI